MRLLGTLCRGPAPVLSESRLLAARWLRRIHRVTDKTSIRDRASAALREAMKARDVEAVAALRTLLAEFANAEASPPHLRAGAIEEAPALGAAEVERLHLSEADLTAIAVREHDELARAADAANARESAQGNRWRRRQEALARLLDH
jgi:uncharacterized protein